MSPARNRKKMNQAVDTVNPLHTSYSRSPQPAYIMQCRVCMCKRDLKECCDLSASVYRAAISWKAIVYTLAEMY